MPRAACFGPFPPPWLAPSGGARRDQVAEDLRGQGPGLMPPRPKGKRPAIRWKAHRGRRYAGAAPEPQDFGARHDAGGALGAPMPGRACLDCPGFSGLAGPDIILCMLGVRIWHGQAPSHAKAPGRKAEGGTLRERGQAGPVRKLQGGVRQAPPRPDVLPEAGVPQGDPAARPCEVVRQARRGAAGKDAPAIRRRSDKGQEAPNDHVPKEEGRRRG